MRINIGADGVVVHTLTAVSSDNTGIGSIPSPVDWLGDKIKTYLWENVTEGATEFVVHFLTVLPLVAVMSFGVHVLLGMFSKTLAKWGVIAIVAYSALLILFD